MQEHWLEILAGRIFSILLYSGIAFLISFIPNSIGQPIFWGFTWAFLNEILTELKLKNK